MRRCARRARVRIALVLDSCSRWLRIASGWAAAQGSGSMSSRRGSSACKNRGFPDQSHALMSCEFLHARQRCGIGASAAASATSNAALVSLGDLVHCQHGDRCGLPYTQGVFLPSPILPAGMRITRKVPTAFRSTSTHYVQIFNRLFNPLILKYEIHFGVGINCSMPRFIAHAINRKSFMADPRYN